MVMRSINCGFLPFCIIYRHYLYHEICLTSPQNSKITSNKFSSVEKTMNSCFLAYLALLLLEVIITLMIIITLVLVNHENMRNWKNCPFTSKTLARTLVLPFLTHLEHSQAIAKSKILRQIFILNGNGFCSGRFGHHLGVHLQGGHQLWYEVTFEADSDVV